METRSEPLVSSAPMVALPLETPGWDCFDDLHEGIGYALTWTELEAWVAQADRAHAMGQLGVAELEALTEWAVQVSRGVAPRDPEPRPHRRRR